MLVKATLRQTSYVTLWSCAFSEVILKGTYKHWPVYYASVLQFLGSECAQRRRSQPAQPTQWYSCLSHKSSRERYAVSYNTIWVQDQFLWLAFFLVRVRTRYRRRPGWKSDAVHNRGSGVPEGPGGRGGELYFLATRDRCVSANDWGGVAGYFCITAQCDDHPG